MIGNVSEWCNGAFVPYEAPGYSELVKYSRNRHRAARGGSYAEQDPFPFSYYRYRRESANCDDGSGFRVLLEIPDDL